MQKRTSVSESVVKPDRLQAGLDRATEFFRSYFWFIFKNVMGWILIVAAFPVGIVVPGPGGIPIFLIGFALVTFPGKRKLTSRVMSGRGLALNAGIFTFLTALLSIGVTVGLMWFINERYDRILAHFKLNTSDQQAGYTNFGAALVGVALIALIVTWAVTRVGLQILNFFLRRAPKIRRYVRPWLRRHGINILPTRRKQGTTAPQSEEILEFSEAHQDRVRMVWAFLKPWLRRAASVGITIFIVVQMFGPLRRRWPQVRAHMTDLSLINFIIACFMFALFLLLFRALVWRRILKAFGHRLPVGPAVRIWSTSELARYLPGAIWQVIGRVFLVRPYGVPGSICSTTQVLELCIFLLANVLVALTCSFYFGAKELEQARIWMYVAMGLVPFLGALLHPKIFYALVNFILVRLGKPKIIKRLRGKNLIQLLIWTIIGLMWQSLAVYLITQPLLGLKIDWLWMAAGAYCLAWCAGFLAFWAPGGIGVRELVFFIAMQLALPPSVKSDLRFSDPDALAGLLVFISFVLRLWTVIGELILAAAAYIVDVRGVIGDPHAPGRIPMSEMVKVKEES